MRLILLLALFPFQAQAWTFTPGLICRLSHEVAGTKIELTFDPAQPLYSISVTSPAPLPDARFFSMRFVGPSGQTISTDRQTRSDDGRSVIVTDTGFGNVLDGLQYNTQAHVMFGKSIFIFPLEDAAAPTAQFRACEAAAGV